MAVVMSDRFNEPWTVDIVGQLHKYRITAEELARECSYAPTYVSTVLNGKKRFESEKSKERTRDILYAGLNRIIQRIEDEYAKEGDGYDEYL